MKSALKILLFLSLPLYLAGQKLGDNSDGSRAVAVHRIKLVDEDSSVIRLDSHPLLPFSARNTCGNCHDYGRISGGLHFNAGDSAAKKGRPGHPWIYADRAIAVQVPISLRGWKGAFKPTQVGLSTLDFLSIFGGQYPGGGAGENAFIRDPEDLFRWRVSGELEINCLLCHDAEYSNDRAEYASQVNRQNFRWAATASSGFAAVRGSAKDMPDNYDIYFGAAPDQPQKIAPSVSYKTHRFNERNEVYFDIVRKIPDENCYFCHSAMKSGNADLSHARPAEDVHLISGMACIDCHTNGLDHKMVRGYAGEENDLPHAGMKYSCAGCHQLGDGAEVPVAGEGGAPKPDHGGLPPLHFKKMECTTCHSGDWPQEKTAFIKTSMAHRLGTHGINKSDKILPHIVSPVFVQKANGIIAPHNFIWPSYWVDVVNDSLRPLGIDRIRGIVASFIVNDDSTGHGNWLPLRETDILRILDSLQLSLPGLTQAGYVTAGELFTQANDSTVKHSRHSSLKPYMWPLAHRVRPAAQSLGINGCTDCHASDSPFYFGEITADTPLQDLPSGTIKMIDYQERYRLAAWIFSYSFLFRPVLKWLVIICCLLIFSVLLVYALRGMERITEAVGEE